MGTNFLFAVTGLGWTSTEERLGSFTECAAFRNEATPDFDFESPNRTFGSSVADPLVAAQRSREMGAAIRAVGGSATVSEYEGAGRNSWEFAYAEPELLNWLCAQHK
jgi:hypothetical protein